MFSVWIRSVLGIIKMYTLGSRLPLLLPLSLDPISFFHGIEMSWHSPWGKIPEMFSTRYWCTDQFNFILVQTLDLST